MLRPGVHKLAALLEQVGPAVGALDLAPDLWPMACSTTACGKVATSSAQVLNVARNPCAVIARPSLSDPFPAPEFMRFSSVRNAMLESGCPPLPGKT